ncbi:MAG: NADH-quinone oxidoreductase subunit G, partial [Parcubacteria group bacterium Athens1014_10]
MKQKKIKIIINGRKIETNEGKTILEAARENKIEIPALCFHSDLKVKANCRICTVEIKGIKGLQTACSTEAKKGMEIITDSPKISKARKINLELIFSQHTEECDDCVWDFNCQILKLAKKYKAEITRFADRKKDYPLYRFGPSIDFDNTKCIICRNCAEVCPVDFLEIKNKGAEIQITPSKDKNKDCIYCGQCVTHCPVGAIEGVGEFEDIEKPLQEKDK